MTNVKTASKDRKNIYSTTKPSESQKRHIALSIAKITLANPAIKENHLCKMFGVSSSLVAWYKNQLKKGGENI